MNIRSKKAFHNVTFEDKKPITLPFNMLIAGSAGSGKSNIVMNLVKLMDNAFDKIYFYTESKNRTLYNYLEMVIPDKDLLEVHEGLDHLNSIDIDNHYFGQTLIIFDGLEHEKDQTKIINLFMRSSILGCSIVCLTQKYWSVSTIIKENLDYLILKSISKTQEVKSILRDGSLDVNKEELLKMYQFCISGDNLTFLMIDFNAKEEHQFRLNFLQVLDINYFR